VIGPFYVPGSPAREYGESMVVEPGAGVPAWVHGRVLDVSGSPIAGAEVDVWQNGADMLYAVQRPEAEEDHLRGRYLTRDDGTYAFVAVRPVPYPIPHDGPVGRMLEVTGRHPWRPAHIHIIARAPGYKTVTTHVFDATSEYLDSDTVFAVKPSLLRTFVERSPDDPERPAGVPEGEWVSLENDILLAPGDDGGAVVDPGRTA
jgi:catechol 1,2-dioxygenase